MFYRTTHSSFLYTVILRQIGNKLFLNNVGKTSGLYSIMVMFLTLRVRCLGLRPGFRVKIRVKIILYCHEC